MKANHLLVLGILISLVALANAGAPPTIGIDVVYPPGDLRVNQDFFFHVTTNVSCLSGGCGDINVSLDPYPPQCTAYAELDWDKNSIYEPYTTGDCTRDYLVPGWYRLTGEYKAIPTQRSYIQLICNTHAPGFIDFSYPTSPAETTSGSICYHWSGNTCNWQSDDIQITNCGGYYVYHLTPSPVCTLHPCTTDEIPPPVSEKTGLVSEIPGTVPFYTNGSNPQTVNLNAGQSQLVTFWVNATGAPWNYTFFAYANFTASPAISNRTDNWTVEVVPAPNVSFIDVPSFVNSGGPAVPVLITLSAENFLGTPESATLDSIWWNDGAADYPYSGPAVHSFPVGEYVLTASANDTEGNVYSSQHPLKVGVVECGDSFDSDAFLTSDLDCSGYDGDAVRIFGNDVVFDCNGHTIFGPDDYVGIFLDNVDGVTVQDCTITGFYRGIYAAYSDSNNIQRNTLSENYYGLELAHSDFNRIMQNEFDSNEYGFYLYYADSNQISNNDVIDSDTANFGSGGSCPFLYLQDGDGYEYYTDLASEVIGKPKYETPLYEAGIYELGDFKSDDGTYRMKIREVIPESDFVDELKLMIVDVPEGYGVLNQWHNTYSDDMAPPKEFMTIKDPMAPLSATDSYGKDVLAEVSEKDGVPLPMKADLPNSVIVDFGPIKNPQHAKLVITGWSAYGTRIEAPSQENLLIETMDENGEWKQAKLFGKFTGDSRTFVFDIADILQADDTRMRITAAYSGSNAKIIDQILLDDSEPVEIEVTAVDPSVADLHWGGSTNFNYTAVEHRISASDEQLPDNEDYLMYGHFTRYGDVRPLLAKTDDMFAIMRHGDELNLEFPDIAPAEGRDRYVFLLADVMYSVKYSGSGEFVSDSVELMPFHGMSQYPYGEGESYPDDPEHNAYRAEWNTRLYETPARYGGSLPWSFNNTVSYNTFIGDEYSTALYLGYENSTKILSNTISGVFIGIDLYESVNTLIEGNTVNTAKGRAMMLRGESDGNTVRFNNLRSDNSDECDSYFDESGNCGTLFIGGSEDNTIEYNTLTSIDSYGMYLGKSDSNTVSNNKITASGNYEAIYITKESEDNTFLQNTLRSDYWVYDDSGGNDFSDDTYGNRYYAGDGTPSWEIFDMADTDGDGWADEGDDLPFSCESVGECDSGYDFWDGSGEDFHPATTSGESGSDDDDGGQEGLSVDLSSSCDGNVVTVSSGGDEVSGARVYVKDSSGNEVALGYSDEDGEMIFPGCGMEVSVHASHSDYLPADSEFDLVGCEECTEALPPELAPELPQAPECTDDTACIAAEECVNSECVPVRCECGAVQAHTCVEYGCCADADCADGQACIDHFCVEKPPAPECATDAECASGKECREQKCVEKPAPPAEDPLKADAVSAIAGAQEAISSSKGAGKDTGAAEAKLNEAKAALEAENYEQAKDLAAQAKTLAMNAGAAPGDSGEPEPAAPKGGLDAGLVVLLLFAALALGGVYWFAIKKKK